MCPHRKLEWFASHGRTTSEIGELKQLVISRWNETYATSSASSMSASTPSTSSTTSASRHGRKVCNQIRLYMCLHDLHLSQRSSKWTAVPGTLNEIYIRPIDDINTYLDDPVISQAVLDEAGGLMQYWHQAFTLRPRLAKMASDYCSAPGMY